MTKRRLPVSVFFLALLLPVCAGVPLRAQDPPLESRIPARTVFYMSWRGGQALAAARTTNSLLRLWDDPEFAPLRAALLTKLFSSELKQAPTLNRDELATLLENSMLVGVMPSSRVTSAPGARTAQKGFESPAFLIYDRNGREKLADRLSELGRNEEPKPTITHSTFRGIDIEIQTRPAKTSYQAIAGRYFVDADGRELMEELVTRLTTPGLTANSLGATEEYKTAHQRMDPNSILEIFVSLKGFTKEMYAQAAGKQPGAETFLRGLHFDQLGSLSVTLSSDGPATRIRLAVLGDLAPGGLLDIIGPGKAEFSTLAAVPATALSCTSLQIDLSAFYKTLRAAITTALPPEQAQNFGTFESAIASQFGMTIPEMVSLLSGEFTMVGLEPTTELSNNLYLFSISKPQDVLHLLRAMLSDRITNEDQSGEITYLAVLSPLGPKAGATPTRRFYYVAVGPRLLVVAPRKALAREMMSRFESADHAGSILADTDFQRARARLPQKLSGLGFSNVSRVDWKAVMDKLQQSLAPQDKNKDAAELLKLLTPGVFSRYLHSAGGGWWKDQQGLYYDGFLE